MDLVIGATGYLGLEICKGLRRRGRNVRAMVREGSDRVRVETLRDIGAAVVVGDLKDPGSLAKVCRGASVVISTASSTLSRQDGDSIESVDRDGQLSLIASARAAAVGHFVFISFPHDPTDFPLQDAKRTVEATLRGSGLGYTILHPTHFREIWLSPALGFDPAGGHVRVFGKGEGRISWISLHDVALAAVAAVDNPRALNRVLELGGDRALTQAEVIALLEKEAGRTFKREMVPESDLEAMIRSDDPLTRSFGALMLACARHGCPVDNGPAAEVLDFRPRPFTEYVSECLK